MAIRLDKDGLPIVASESFETKQFSIAVDKMAFRALSDSVYSRKIRAIVRELSTNAFDAHVAAGKRNIPFDVHLPTYHEPHFSVRDYGIGLSETDIFELYSTYFKSSVAKLQSNDYVGCFGIGSKSPFCYAESFTVVSYFEGKRTGYTAYINASGIPSISKLHEEDTTECNGLEVTVPVKGRDIYNFQQEAIEVYQYFATKPKITGMSTVVPTIEYGTSGTGWKFRKTGGGTCRAIMGNVYYDISAGSLPGLTDEDKKLILLPIDINWNIGDLSVTLSRENLEYDDATVAHVKKRLEVVRREIAKIINDEIASCKSLWQARCLFHAYRFGKGSEKHTLAAVVDLKDVTWNGQPLLQVNIDLSAVQGIQCIEFKSGRDRWDSRSQTWLTTAKQHPTATITPKGGVGLYEVDQPSVMNSRCLKAVRDEVHNVVYLLEFKTQEARKQTFELLGLSSDDIKPCSTLPRPTINRPNGIGACKAKVFKYDDSKNRSESAQYAYWDPTEITVEDGGIYLEMDRYSVVGADGYRLKSQSLCDRIQILRSLGYKDPIYGLRKTVVEKFKESGDWTSLWDYIKNVVQLEVNRRNLAKHQAYTLAYGHVKYSGKFCDWWLENPQFTTSAQICKFMETLANVRKLLADTPYDVYNNIGKLADTVGFQIPQEKVEDLKAAERDILRRYPLLEELFKRCQYGMSLDAVAFRKMAAYCDMVEECLTNRQTQLV